MRCMRKIGFDKNLHVTYRSYSDNHINLQKRTVCKLVFQELGKSENENWVQPTNGATLVKLIIHIHFPSFWVNFPSIKNSRIRSTSLHLVFRFRARCTFQDVV